MGKNSGQHGRCCGCRESTGRDAQEMIILSYNNDGCDALWCLYCCAIKFQRKKIKAKTKEKRARERSAARSASARVPFSPPPTDTQTAWYRCTNSHLLVHQQLPTTDSPTAI